MVTYPKDWNGLTLGDLGSIKMCRRIFSHQTEKSGQIPFYKIGTFGKKADAYISRDLYESYKSLYPYPKKGDILVSAAGTIGRTVVFDGKDAYFQDSNIVWLDTSDGEVDSAFLKYFYESYPWTNLEGTTIRRLYNSLILGTSISLPSLPEQKVIAETLSCIDTHIANLTELIEKKKAIRDGALEYLVSGRTRLDGFDGDWEEKSLLECVDLIQGLTYAPENVKSYGILVLRSSNIQNNRLALNDNVYVDISVSETKMIQNGDILICVRNGSSALIGKSCTLNEMPHTTFGAFMSVLRGDKTGFISKAFESHYIQRQVRDRTNATINQITKKDFEQIRILLPSQPEQISIVQVISSMDAEIASFEEEKDKMLQIKAGAMDDLLTGRVRLTRQGG